ncbi:hypothetical protein TCSYLVIO_007812 [Trypanosoma cruzi]|nr:hypothetical protein TCSYLVIO_007812 [Trypanosoma cruzi]
MHLAAIKRPSTSISRQTPNVKGLIKKQTRGWSHTIHSSKGYSLNPGNKHRKFRSRLIAPKIVWCPSSQCSAVRRHRPLWCFSKSKKKKHSQTNSKENLHPQCVHHRGALPLSPQVKQAPSHHPQGSPQTRQIAKYATRSTVTIVFPIGQPTPVHRVCRAGHTRPVAATQKDSEIRNGSRRSRWLSRRVEVWDGRMKENKTAKYPRGIPHSTQPQWPKGPLGTPGGRIRHTLTHHHSRFPNRVQRAS